MMVLCFFWHGALINLSVQVLLLDVFIDAGGQVKAEMPAGLYALADG